MEEALTTRLRYEQGIISCSQTLLEDGEHALETVLQHLLHASDASRVYIFENFEDPDDGLCMKQTHEACASGIIPQMTNPQLQYLPYQQGAPRLQQHLSQNLPYTGIVGTFPEEERRILEVQGIISILILPIMVGKEWLGFVGFDDTVHQREWDENDIRLLKTAAEMIGCHVERRRSGELLQKAHDELEIRVDQRTSDLQHVNDQLSTLYNIGQLITAPLELNAVLDVIACKTAEMLKSDTGVILLLDEAEKFLTIAGACGLSDNVIQHTRDRVGHSLAGRVVQSGEAIIANDLPHDPRFENPSANSEGLLACASVPLRIGEKIIGTLDAHSKSNPHMFTEEHVTLMSMLASQAAIAIEHARLYERMQHSHHELEQRVQERTADLREANTRLMQEIIKRKEAETTLRQMNKQLQNINRQKSDFLADMSHELRTPLTSVLGFCEVLQEQVYGSLNAKQLRAIQNIEESGQHLLELINEILDIAKIEAGKLDLESNAVPVEQVCQASLLFIKQSARKKHLIVSSQIDPMVTIIQTDQRRLKQILVNLLSNAVKFTPEKGQVLLEVQGDIQRKLIHFSIRDTGPGIAPEKRKELFEPFVQLDSNPSRNHEGTGLGLALVHRLTKVLEGDISLESEIGKGSCFTVSLPWSPGRTDLRPVDEKQPDEGEQFMITDQQSAITILLADDNQDSCEMISEYLQTLGHQVILASNGKEAIQQAKEQQPDVILMDIQMPVMDGLEAIRHLKTDPTLAKISIIALTALAMRGDRERCLDAGADAYLSKPVGLKKMLSLIQTLLAR